MSTPNRQGKTMSSRLLNMKFMQRSAPSTPGSATSESEPPSKRRRTEEGSTNSTPGLDWKGAQAAKEAEELQRSKALEKHVENYAQSHWTLDSTKDFSADAKATRPIVKVGYGAIDGSIKYRKGKEDDSDSEEGEDQVSIGRKSFGNFKSAAANGGDQVDEEDDDDDDDSEVDSDSDSDSSGDSGSQSPENGDSVPRAKRKRERDEDPERVPRNKSRGTSQASTPSRAPQQDAKLRKLQSISSGGSNRSTMRCHVCGKPGHLKRDCPNTKSRKNAA